MRKQSTLRDTTFILIFYILHGFIQKTWYQSLWLTAPSASVSSRYKDLWIIRAIFQVLEAFKDKSILLDHLWSSLIISDQSWPTCDRHHHTSGISPLWSPGFLLVYGDFFNIFCSSGVSFLPIFVEFQFFPLISISTVQNLGSRVVLIGLLPLVA